ncbi:MAG: hypothetical protein O3A80_03940 [bacterium]|nr:hypothetical protein [bacterium]MDA1292341.1 hypothetical protein [bacterium]
MRIIEKRKYPNDGVNIAGKGVNTTNTDNYQSTIRQVLIGIIATVVGGIILYALTSGF